MEKKIGTLKRVCGQQRFFFSGPGSGPGGGLGGPTFGSISGFSKNPPPPVAKLKKKTGVGTICSGHVLCLPSSTHTYFTLQSRRIDGSQKVFLGNTSVIDVLLKSTPFTLTYPPQKKQTRVLVWVRWWKPPGWALRYLRTLSLADSLTHSLALTYLLTFVLTRSLIKGSHFGSFSTVLAQKKIQDF